MTMNRESTSLSARNMKKIRTVSNFYGEFEVLKQLGKGAFGKVMMCKNRTTGLVAAVKVLAKLRNNPISRKLV